MFDEFLSQLSPSDKEKGQKIQADLFEKMRSVTPVTDRYKLPDNWTAPKG
ncbi:hypothetical protein [Duganella sp. BJB1802]|nr:hypothetical protein [Duganella sp. BJB1802]